MRTVAFRTAVFTAIGLLMAAAAWAQDRVRVTRDQTVIWKTGFIVVETIVPSGTELEVVGRIADWYQVVVPGGATSNPTTGFVAVARVEPLEGAQFSPQRASIASVTDRPLARRGVRGFAHVGVGRFAARQTFASVFGSAAGLWLGGGIEGRQGPWTFEGAVEIFRRTGERVFALDGQVFPLGIPDTVTLVPVTGTIGYRHPVSRRWSIVAGAGAGRYVFRESSDVADEAETFSTQATSYHVRGALEWRRRGPLAIAVEAQHTWVPRALTGGLSTQFDEHDLGGLQIRLKILVGR